MKTEPLRHGQGGFTSVELMVVLLVIGILLAIGLRVPRSQDAGGRAPN